MIRHYFAPLVLAGLILPLSAFASGRSSISPAASSAPPCSLSLPRCFALAQENNATLRASLAAVQAVKGEDLVAVSRLLPHLNLIFGGAARQEILTDSLTRAGRTLDRSDGGLSLQLSQRIAEFGPTTETEFDRLRRRRAVLYAGEKALVGQLSAVRSTYFTLRIIQDQLARHDSLYGIYTARLAQTQSRLEEGVGRKFETFTARLNCLDERERILDLTLKQRAQTARLKELLGLTRMPDSVRLITAPAPLALPADSCVALAMRTNTEIADAQEEARLAKRRLLETGWEFAPDVSISAGWRKERTAANLRLSNAQPDAAHRWALDVVGSQMLVPPATDPPLAQPFDAPLAAFNDTTLRYTAMLTIEFPILQGGRRAGRLLEETARYDQARNDVIARTRDLERRILEAWYGYQTVRDQLTIQMERVAIDRERFTLAETMKELDRLTEGEMDGFRSRVFSSQDAFFALQFRALEAEEQLRALMRQLD